LLPNGNVLITSMFQGGKLVEINQNDQIVWEYLNPVNDDGSILNQGDPHNENNRIWRATKYPIDYPAFLNQNLTANGTVENGTNTSLCSVYPNPAICDSCLVCQKSIVLPNIISDNPFIDDVYIFDDYISSSSNLMSNSGNSVIYEVGDEYIELTSGFAADGLVTFSANINDCNDYD